MLSLKNFSSLKRIMHILMIKKLCSSKKKLDETTIVLSAYPKYQVDKLERIFHILMSTGGLRLLMHSVNLNLCYVACGRYDGLIGFYKTLPEWDKVPGFFILEKAGGVVTDFSGKAWCKDTTKFIASNRQIHKLLLELIGGI